MHKLLIVANVSKEHIRKFHIPFIIRMKEQGWQVDVACRMDAPVPECDNAYDLPCNRNPFGGGVYKSIRLLREILQRNRYNVILCNTVTGSIVARLAARSFRKNGLKVFYINHGLHFFKGAPINRWIMGYPVEKLLAPCTDVLITINSADYDMAKKYLRVAVVERIHGIGVDLRRFRNCQMSEVNKERMRKTLGFSPKDFVLTYVAEINENKNQFMLLEAFNIVSQAIPNTKMLLVGPEHDDGKVRNFICKYGLKDKVLLLGWREDIPELLKISDVYVASSKSEGLGVNIIEAMACNLPVIASKNRGHAEIIRHEVNGFLVEQNDFEEMAAYVLRLSDDAALREAVTKQAQADILKYESNFVLNELQHIFDLYT